jgi:MOSC domain-containing protein YiiM
MQSAANLIEAIYIGLEAAAPMQKVPAIRATAERGLEGDRYSRHAGTWSRPPRMDSQVTLIEAEAIDAVNRDYKLGIEAAQTRRNIVTRGVALNHLVGRRFRVGDVTLEGTKLCDPCNHLEKLTKPGVKFAFTHRGGLCANIVTGGLISVGDTITTE